MIVEPLFACVHLERSDELCRRECTIVIIVLFFRDSH